MVYIIYIWKFVQKRGFIIIIELILLTLLCDFHYSSYNNIFISGLYLCKKFNIIFSIEEYGRNLFKISLVIVFP